MVIENWHNLATSGWLKTMGAIILVIPLYACSEVTEQEANTFMTLDDEQFAKVMQSIPDRCLDYYTGALYETVVAEHSNHQIIDPRQYNRIRPATAEETQQTIARMMQLHESNCKKKPILDISLRKNVDMLPKTIQLDDFDDERVIERYIALKTIAPEETP